MSGATQAGGNDGGVVADVQTPQQGNNQRRGISPIVAALGGAGAGAAIATAISPGALKATLPYLHNAMVKGAVAGAVKGVGGTLPHLGPEVVKNMVTASAAKSVGLKYPIAWAGEKIAYAFPWLGAKATTLAGSGVGYVAGKAASLPVIGGAAAKLTGAGTAAATFAVTHPVLMGVVGAGVAAGGAYLGYKGARWAGRKIVNGYRALRERYRGWREERRRRNAERYVQEALGNGTSVDDVLRQIGLEGQAVPVEYVNEMNRQIAQLQQALQELAEQRQQPAAEGEGDETPQEDGYERTQPEQPRPQGHDNGKKIVLGYYLFGGVQPVLYELTVDPATGKLKLEKGEATQNGNGHSGGAYGMNIVQILQAYNRCSSGAPRLVTCQQYPVQFPCTGLLHYVPVASGCVGCGPVIIINNNNNPQYGMGGFPVNYHGLVQQPSMIFA